MATRGLSYRSLQLRDKENPQPLKAVGKLVEGPVVRRGVLQNIGNKNIVRSTSVTGKDVIKKPFKAPLQKKIALKKNPVVQNVEPVQEVSMVSICVPPEDMSVVDVKPEDNERSVKNICEQEENVELQPSPVKDDEDVAELSAAFSNKMLAITDIDAEDADNPQLVSCYVNDIYEYMRLLEDKHPITPRYLDGHEVSSRMRCILVDWLCQVHNRFNLMAETLYLTITIVDRFLQVYPDTDKNKLQLVGVAAMFMAGKYEEMYCSEINDYVYVTDKAYTKFQIRSMESRIFKTLHFYISFPLPLHFLRRNSKAGRVDGRHHMLAKYLMELSLVEYSLCHFKASQIAAASLFLTISLLSPEQGWDDTLAFYSSYSEKEILPCVVKLAQCVKRSHASKYQSVQLKYANSKYMKISTLPELKGRVLQKLAETKL